MLSKRSRSAETVDSVEDVMRPALEAVVSERNIPRSRLSANLAQLEAARTAWPRGRELPLTQHL